MAVRVLSVLLYGVWCIRDDSVLFFHVANSQPYTLTVRDIGIFFFLLSFRVLCLARSAMNVFHLTSQTQ